MIKNILLYTQQSQVTEPFEEEVMLSGFAQAQVKAEGSGVVYDKAQETYTADTLTKQLR